MNTLPSLNPPPSTAALRFNTLAFAWSAVFSLTSAATALPFVQRRTHARHPLQSCHFRAILPRIRHPKMTIQRHQPNFPPTISAEIMHKLQKVLPIVQPANAFGA